MPEERLIDANALKQHYNVPDAKGTFSYCDTIMRVIDEQPTIESEPVRHGRWIVHMTWNGMFWLIHSECSECKFDRNGDLSSWKFCPNCGARMDADEIADVSKKVGGDDK